MNNNLPILFRPATIQDQNYILSSWLKAYRNHKTMRNLPSSTYYNLYKKIVLQLLSESNVAVACNPDEPAQIYSYAVYTFDRSVFVLHWVNTKFIYRKLNVATDLLKAIYPDFGKELTVCTHSTSIFGKVKEKYNLIFKQ